MAGAPPPSLLLHATTVALAGRGAVVITGASGSGKSGLGLELMALGCDLVADDRTLLSTRDGGPWAFCPPGLEGLIEARFVGLLRARAAAPSPVALAVDLDRTEADRLPLPRHVAWLGARVPLLHKAATPGFAAALLQYLKVGRLSPDP